MCWTTFIYPHIQIATENIPVYKIVDKKKGFWFWSTFSSYYYGFTYKLHKRYSEKLGRIWDPCTGLYAIDEGIHSYHNTLTRISTSKYGDRWIRSFNGEILDNYCTLARTIVKVQGYIPKGSKYYLNEDGEYVSEQIVLTKYNKIK